MSCKPLGKKFNILGPNILKEQLSEGILLTSMEVRSCRTVVRPSFCQIFVLNSGLRGK